MQERYFSIRLILMGADDKRTEKEINSVLSERELSESKALEALISTFPIHYPEKA